MTLSLKYYKACCFALFSLSILSVPTIILAQKFNDNGFYQPAALNGGIATTERILHDNRVMNAREAEQTLQKLLEIVQETRNNLMDDSLHLKEIYNGIWGSTTFYDNLSSELSELENWLKDKTYRYKTGFVYVPNPIEIQNEILNKKLFYGEPDGEVNPNNTKEFILNKIDPLQNWLFCRFQATLQASPLKDMEMDIDYLDGWRIIESYWNKLSQYRKYLEVFDQNLSLYDESKIGEIISFLCIDFSNLKIRKLLENDAFTRKWLWYTGGIIQINPLMVTTNNRQYPQKEANSFFTKEMAQLIDSLKQLKLLDKFSTTSATFNKVILPIPPAKKLNNHSTTYILQYDANNKYHLYNNNLKNKTIWEKDSIAAFVHNVGNKLKADFSVTNIAVPDESRAINILNSATAGIGSLIGKITAARSDIEIVRSYIRPYTSRPIDGTIISKKDDGTSFIKKFAEIEDNVKEMVDFKIKPWIIIDGKFVPLTVDSLDEDKRRILWTTFRQQNPKKTRTPADFFEKIVEPFLRYDHFNFFNYYDAYKSSDSLIIRFNIFQKDMEHRQKTVSELSEKLNNVAPIIFSLTQVSMRSLPPNSLKEQTDDSSPTYETKPFDINVTEGPSKLTYTLKVTDSRIAKPEESTKVAIKETIKVIKKTWLDFSIGLGYTFNNYDISSQTSETALPTVESADRFKFIAGLHYYPFGLIKTKDKIIGNVKERLSIYVGLSIRKPLDNYYVGLSYDLVPGIRVIAGPHFYRNYRYDVINNQVIDKASGIRAAGFFTAVNLEPLTILNLVGLFN